MASKLLLETADVLLLEFGDALLLEEAKVATGRLELESGIDILLLENGNGLLLVAPAGAVPTLYYYENLLAAVS